VVSTAYYPQGYVLKTAPSVGMVGTMYIPRMGGSEEPAIAWFQLTGQPVVMFSP